MSNFYEEKFKQINSLKYLMTAGFRGYEGNVYKEKLLEVFKEFEAEFNDSYNENAAENYRVDKNFTLEELATFNGQNGKAAYIAINGKVYDVTGVTLFNKKPHNSLPLGTDLTKQLNQCHNGDMSLLKGLTQVGTLIGAARNIDEVDPIIPEGNSRRFL